MRAASLTCLLLVWFGVDRVVAKTDTGGSAGEASWQAFRLEELGGRRAASGREYLEFLDRSSMSAGLYVLDAGADDRQAPHRFDEVYVVLSGTAVLEIGEETMVVRRGSVAFVKAGEPHRFIDIVEDLEVLVVFSKGKTEDRTPPSIVVELDDLERHAEPDENVWHPFVDVPSMVFGLYLLPEDLDGDSTLVHEVDEINIVVAGRSRFTMGDDTIDVAPGSIVFVERGVGHSFAGLDQDFRVLILFVKKTD